MPAPLLLFHHTVDRLFHSGSLGLHASSESLLARHLARSKIVGVLIQDSSFRRIASTYVEIGDRDPKEEENKVMECCDIPKTRNETDQD